MKIILRIEGNDKEFVNDFIPGRILRRAVEITRETNLSNIGTDELDRLVDFVVEAFGKQFTRDEFYDGVEAFGMIQKVMNVINEVIESAAKSIGEDGSDPNSQQKA